MQKSTGDDVSGRRHAPGVLDEAAVDALVSIADPVARNLAITRGYHLLAAEVGRVLGSENANWLCFGQWASAEAGRAIRGESVPSPLRPLVAAGIAEAVAGGNAAVFGDVAPPFIRFIRAVEADPEVLTTPRAACAMLDRLVSHPQLAASEDLQRAFTAYTDALLLRDADGPAASKRRAERIFVANVSIGAHEQVLADPYVRAAIPGGWIVAIASTAHLGVRIPDGLLSLNRDVPPPGYLGGAAFPPGLTHFEDPDALALAVRFGQDPLSAKHSDAPNWESYHERMGFIFTFLRAYQQDTAMFEMPGA
jgi:hypothetical protein